MEELPINYNENRSLDDSGFQELPCMPSSAYSMEKFQHLYISNYTKEQLVSLWKKIGKKVQVADFMQSFQEKVPEEKLVEMTENTSNKCAEQLVLTNFKRMPPEQQKNCLNKLFAVSASVQ